VFHGIEYYRLREESRNPFSRRVDDKHSKGGEGQREDRAAVGNAVDWTETTKVFLGRFESAAAK